MKTELLTFKQKDKLLQYIYSTYRKTKLQLKLMDIYFNPYPQSENMLKETVTNYNYNYLHKRLDKKRNLELFIKMIEQIHQNVSKESAIILENEYLERKDKGWWQQYFSRATYYRFKHQAMDEFFNYYDESLLAKRL